MKRIARGDAALAARLGLGSGERVLVAIGPSAWAIVTERWRELAMLVVAAVVCARFVPEEIGGTRYTLQGWLVTACVVLGLLVLVVQAAKRAARVHVVTNERVISAAGVLRRVVAQAPLSRVQQIAVVKTASERAVGIGTVIVETAGSGLGAVVIFAVPRPERVAAIVRAASRRRQGVHGRSERRGSGGAMASPKHASGVLVLGIAGGIGSGKSAVAAAAAHLGCVVVDSDKESRAALDRTDVKDALVGWWGGSVLDESGAVDRKKVAEIVFRDPAQRQRLEGLLHPLVRQSRAEMVKRAAARGVRVVIVDAPLLFEAGVDRECDAVVFVDAPEAIRLERVRQTRGWTKEELERREAAQLDLVEKRRRCRYVVTNSGDQAALAAAVESVLVRAKQDFGVT